LEEFVKERQLKFEIYDPPSSHYIWEIYSSPFRS
jgi:hypothetical protein